MKRILAVALIMSAGIAQAAPIYLACKGITTEEYRPMTNLGKTKEIKRKSMLINLTVNPEKKTIITSTSDITNFEEVPGLDLSYSDQFYLIPSYNRKTEGYRAHTIYISINRFTGSVEIDTYTLTNNHALDNKFVGTCDVGVSWQPKF
jgi:hypothetical protein